MDRLNLKSPCILPNTNTGNGAQFIQTFRFGNGHEVPIYNVENEAAFNQLIGYAKYLNANYGSVYYRGVNALYDNVRPSIMRKRSRGIAEDLTSLIHNINDNDKLKRSLHLLSYQKPQNRTDYNVHNNNKKIKRNNKYRIEALLQHYCGFTRFLDVVDNHWIALWMGLHDFHECGEGSKYVSCIKREVLPIDILFYLNGKNSRADVPDEEFPDKCYEYILLMAFPEEGGASINGVYETQEFVLVDLRKALPSFYLRPHAQHALVMRRRDRGEDSYDASYYDMASQVVGIIRVRIDIADKWVGNGILVKKDNMFPLPSIDAGYNSLLKNSVFKHPFEIKKYF
ncbi:MAG: FRG domain-containing protein [Muribaculaceae bacterium]|nr:FRG domain-containing protein [Muribaculaceae bacterium]